METSHLSALSKLNFQSKNKPPDQSHFGRPTKSPERVHWKRSRDDRDRTLFEFEKRISHNCVSLVAKKRWFSWVNRDNDRNSEAIESMVESEP